MLQPRGVDGPLKSDRRIGRVGPIVCYARCIGPRSDLATQAPVGPALSSPSPYRHLVDEPELYDVLQAQS